MDHAKNGNLRKNLPNIAKRNWYYKLAKLNIIITGLNTMHQQNLIHCDFHDGNILNHNHKDDKDKVILVI